MEHNETGAATDERLDLAALYPDLVRGLTPQQLRSVENDLLGGYLETGRTPSRALVQQAVDVATGRSSNEEIISQILSEARDAAPGR